MQELQHTQFVTRKSFTRRLGLWVLIPLAAAVVVAFVLSLRWKDSLKIHRVTVAGSKILRAQDVFAWAGVATNTPMYRINIFDVQGRLQRQPFIKSVRVSRQMPDMIRIDIEERQPIASINIGQVQYVDAEGVLLPYDQIPVRVDVPMISGIRSGKGLVLGKVVESDQLVGALDVLQTALAIDSTVYHLISEVRMSDETIVLYSADGGVPINLGKGDIAKKLQALQAFWQKFIKPGDADRLRYIDLRFEGQVVVKWNHDPDNQSNKYSS